MSNICKDREVVLGVDTHLDIHVGAVIDVTGILLGTRSISVSSTGYSELIDWASSFGCLRRAGVEGTGTYGAALSDALTVNGVTVLEVNRSDRAKRRLQGKSDPTDAENAARAVLAGTATAIPKHHQGACEAMRIASVARRSAVKARTQAINQIRALLVSAPQEVREKLWRVKAQDCVNACLKIRVLGSTPHLTTLAVALKSIARRWQSLSKEVILLDGELDRLTKSHASKLRSRFGVGPNTAAILLSVAGDNPGRLKSELLWPHYVALTRCQRRQEKLYDIASIAEEVEQPTMHF